MSDADWQSIVREHGPMAFDVGWRILGNAADVEEVVQEALLEAFRLHQQQEVANWGGLLRHLVTCRALDRFRKKRPDNLFPFDSIAHSSEESPDEVAIERELAEELRIAIAKLSERESTVFSLRYFGEMKNGEIAERLNISSEAVAVALHKARTKLKALLNVEQTNQRR